MIITFDHPNVGDIAVESKTICIVRTSVSGEGGRTMIQTMGGAVFVDDEYEVVVQRWQNAENPND